MSTIGPIEDQAELERFKAEIPQHTCVQWPFRPQAKSALKRNVRRHFSTRNNNPAPMIDQKGGHRGGPKFGEELPAADFRIS
jgi:hypothetical protein